ncbi:MAG: hypothetical protein LBM06_07935, partial [Prevotellaceae bacterium]|jgi:hypothetical protein|nr:hypothetical protein [Prevotellaceae bacterium]
MTRVMREQTNKMEEAFNEQQLFKAELTEMSNAVKKQNDTVQKLRIEQHQALQIKDNEEHDAMKALKYLPEMESEIAELQRTVQYIASKMDESQAHHATNDKVENLAQKEIDNLQEPIGYWKRLFGTNRNIKEKNDNLKVPGDDRYKDDHVENQNSRIITSQAEVEALQKRIQPKSMMEQLRERQIMGEIPSSSNTQPQVQQQVSSRYSEMPDSWTREKTQETSHKEYKYLKYVIRGRFDQSYDSPEGCIFRYIESNGNREFEFIENDANTKKALANINVTFDDVCEFENDYEGARRITTVTRGILNSKLEVIKKAIIHFDP